MAFTDPTLGNTINIKKVHITELKTALSALATQAKKTVDFSGLSVYGKVNSVNVKLLQAAVHTLESAFSGNCCQADCCQTCQGCQSCQGCQTQSCQSTSCQKCQSCQSSTKSCQSCQSMEKNCDCNCDCGDGN